MDEAEEVFAFVPLNHNFRQFSPAVKNHLKRVYLTLCFALLACAFGAYVHMVWNVGGVLSSLGLIGSTIWMYSTPSYDPASKRLSILFLSAFLNGVSIGPIIKVVIDHDSSILITGFVGTAVAFACFSAAAMLANRREYLYLGGVLSFWMSILMLVQFAPSNAFQGYAYTFKFTFQLLLGLVIFVGYIVVDTQRIIERAYAGDMDYVKHAFTFFKNFVEVFVKIITIMKMRRILAYKGEKNKGSRKEETDISTQAHSDSL